MIEKSNPEAQESRSGLTKRVALAALLTILALALTVAGLNRLAPITSANALKQLSRSVAGMAPIDLQVDGKTAHVLKGGSGDALVLVHGFTANKDTFNDAARLLTKNYTVYSVDLPGFGDADRDPRADYSIRGQSEYVRSLVAALGIGRVHLGGNSMGGAIVAEYAAQYPDEVASIWLLDAAGTSEMSQSVVAKSFEATGESSLLAKTRDQVVSKFDLLLGQPKFIPYAIEYALAKIGERDFDLHKQILKTLMTTTTPIETRYSNRTTPALIVTGDQDRIIPPASVNTFAKVFVNSKVIVMPGVGHIPMVESPMQTVQDYLEFRSKL